MSIALKNNFSDPRKPNHLRINVVLLKVLYAALVTDTYEKYLIFKNIRASIVLL